MRVAKLQIFWFKNKPHTSDLGSNPGGCLEIVIKTRSHQMENASFMYLRGLFISIEK